MDDKMRTRLMKTYNIFLIFIVLLLVGLITYGLIQVWLIVPIIMLIIGFILIMVRKYQLNNRTDEEV